MTRYEVEHTQRVKGSLSVIAWTASILILAMGAASWFAFYKGVVEFRKRQVVEGRMDARVGVSAEILGPVKLLFHGHGCAEIQRAYIDGAELSVYVHNKCFHVVSDVSLTYRELSPDGTTIESHMNYLNGTDNMEGDEKREQVIELKLDKRVATVVASVDVGYDPGR